MTPEERIAEVVAPKLTISPMECVYRETTTHWHGPLPEGEDEDDYVRSFTYGTLVNDPRGDEARRIAAAVVAAVRSWPPEATSELRPDLVLPARIWGIRAKEASGAWSSSLHGMSEPDARAFAAAHPGTHRLETRLDYGTPWTSTLEDKQP